jgi:pimeloyl-ACP methyl ester carboxylesterase
MAYAVGHAGARIYYEITGARGPNVVLIQGLGLSSRFWFEMPRILSAEHRVITLDNRGTGKSARPRGPYRMAHMADDVAAVLDAAGADRAYVVGISMGGMIAQEVALRHGPRVEGLVLLATWAGVPHVHLPGPRTLATLLVLPLLGRRAGPALSKLLLPRGHRRRARELLSGWPAALAAEPPDVGAFFAQFAAAAIHSTGFRLNRIGCPTVVVSGEEDAIMRKENGAILARRIPNASHEILPGVAHGIPITDEAAIGRALERLRRGSSSAAAT